MYTMSSNILPPPPIFLSTRFSQFFHVMCKKGFCSPIVYLYRRKAPQPLSGFLHKKRSAYPTKLVIYALFHPILLYWSVSPDYRLSIRPLIYWSNFARSPELITPSGSPSAPDTSPASSWNSKSSDSSILLFVT